MLALAAADQPVARGPAQPGPCFRGGEERAPGRVAGQVKNRGCITEDCRATMSRPLGPGPARPNSLNPGVLESKQKLFWRPAPGRDPDRPSRRGEGHPHRVGGVSGPIRPETSPGRRSPGEGAPHFPGQRGRIRCILMSHSERQDRKRVPRLRLDVSHCRARWSLFRVTELPDRRVSWTQLFLFNLPGQCRACFGQFRGARRVHIPEFHPLQTIGESDP